MIDEIDKDGDGTIDFDGVPPPSGVPYIVRCFAHVVPAGRILQCNVPPSEPNLHPRGSEACLQGPNPPAPSPHTSSFADDACRSFRVMRRLAMSMSRYLKRL